jgi:endonuclease/exonuclease/phosphatase family metal-dependent hydrolase
MTSTCFLLLGAERHHKEMHVATYNLRFASPKDVGNLWRDRYSAIASLIRYHTFDIFGTQEGLYSQLEDLSRELPEYNRYGIGRDGDHVGEHCAIFYRHDRYELLHHGNFWLTDKPGVGPRPGWGARFNRICTWIQLYDRISDTIFYVFNAHYDHQSALARFESSLLILQKISEITGGENSPVIVMGDLNSNRTTDAYRNLLVSNSYQLRDSYKVSSSRYEPNGSYSKFRSNSVSRDSDVIDHIFISQHFVADRWAILTDTYHGKFPSDHFPVTVTLTMK